MQRKRIRITGLVQGVFLRAHTKAEADERGLTGFVSNEADGTVLVEAQGEKDLLDGFVEWCRTGPPRARVDSVTIEDLPVSPDLNEFDIQR